MVISTGVDMVKISRIENIIKTKGDKFYEKIFTLNEIDYIYFRNENPQTISGLFASKEAIAKLLGKGIGIVNWKDIEILHDKYNKPYVKLYNEGENIRKELGISTIYLSISHEKDYAIAFAIGEKYSFDYFSCHPKKHKLRNLSINENRDSLATTTSFNNCKCSRAYNDTKLIFPKRKPNSHKGDYGRIGIIAGSTGMIGSACLVSMAALRSGAGLVYNIVPKSLYETFAIKLIEPIIIPVEDNNTGYFILDSQKETEKAIENKDVLALGPGIGIDSERVRYVQNTLLNYNKTIVLDADGINCLSQDPCILSKRKGTTIITPHPGEMGRLLNTSIEEIQQNRVKYSKLISSKYNIITVLKGHETIVTNGKDIYINSTGNPGMATAGSGDVLTGIIASFIGQGIEPYKASKLGVYVHGLAGDLAKVDKGEYGIIARDIVENIPLAIYLCQ